MAPPACSSSHNPNRWFCVTIELRNMIHQRPRALGVECFEVFDRSKARGANGE
jgi:hypothetical protein